MSLGSNSSASHDMVSNVSVVTIVTARDFERIVNNAEPAVMENVDIGNCTTDWTIESLKLKIGINRTVCATFLLFGELG